MTQRLLLMRHAETDALGRVLSGRAATPLNAAGRRAAAAAASWIAGQGPVAALESGPRVRARETAAAVSAACGVAVAASSALDETDFGVWEGRRFADLDSDPDWRAFNGARAHAAPPGGESFRGVMARVGAWLDAIAARPELRVAVTHDDVVKAALIHALSAPPSLMTELVVAPAGVAELRRDGAGRWRLTGLNVPGGAP